LRQAPNVILIGELRDRETIELAIMGAETGHLVLSTLHTNDSVQTINRMLNAFPPQEQDSIRITLANVLKCCIAQRLVPRSDGKGRLPILDILVNTPAVRDQIIKGQLDQLYELIKNGGFDGMQSTNQALLTLYRMGLIDYSTCMSTAEDKQGMAMLLRSEMRNFKENAEAAIRARKDAEREAQRAADRENFGEGGGETEAESRVPAAEEGQRPGTGPLRAPEEGAQRPGTGQLRPPGDAPPQRPGTGQLRPPGDAPPQRPGTGPLRPPGTGGPPQKPGSGPLKR
jgi:hypothetical protein